MQSYTGVDIGTSSIKLVKVQSGNVIRVITALHAPITKNLLTSDNPKDQEELANALRKIMHEGQISQKEVALALPESQVFTRVIDMPALTEQEVASALNWQAEQYIPLPLSEVNLDFSIIHRPTDTKDKMKVLLIAAPVKVINRYSKILELSGLTASFLETEIVAYTRIFKNQALSGNALLAIDWGFNTTDVGIIADGAVLFTHSIPVGGDALSRAIAEAFSFQYPQAEEYKKTYGLDINQLQGNVQKTLRPVIDSILGELKKSMAFYDQKFSIPIKSVMVLGGGALMPGLVSYVAESLSLEVQIANPWESYQLDPSINAIKSLSSFYSIATGLSLRELIE